MKNNEDWLTNPECGKGWNKILRELDKEIKKLAPDYKIEQIKQKFGDLRYYVSGIPNNVSSQIYELISEAEELSSKTCESCGAPGKLAYRKTNGWLKVVCEFCLGDREFCGEECQ